MSTQRVSDRFTCRHVPESDRLVHTPARQSLPVGAECDAQDPVLMSTQRVADRFTCCHIPEMDRLVRTTRQGFPVRAERDIPD